MQVLPPKLPANPSLRPPLSARLAAHPGIKRIEKMVKNNEKDINKDKDNEKDNNNNYKDKDRRPLSTRLAYPATKTIENRYTTKSPQKVLL